MGFPTWTLIGMGLTFSLALLMVSLAYLAQSPGTAAKLGLANTRFYLRAKSFTGYALALMMLSLGFFIAGVPLDPAVTDTAVASTNTPVTSSSNQETAVTDTAVISATLTISQTSNTADFDLTPSSGAFAGPPPSQEETGAIAPEEIEASANVTPAANNSPTPVTFTPTATPSPTATATASPTITPTPIDEATAVLNLAGGVVWLYRSPGGQTLVILQDQEVVILGDSYANRAGVIWRQVSTGDGTLGWVEETFLQFEEEQE